ncbi:MAG: hypothetical protein JWQ04_2997 [Pedosphaera sp.]|nr:hypothetical protein [Pedosphaera sp.]
MLSFTEGERIMRRRMMIVNAYRTNPCVKVPDEAENIPRMACFRMLGTLLAATLAFDMIRGI